jgi:hypothetical protein
MNMPLSAYRPLREHIIMADPRRSLESIITIYPGEPNADTVIKTLIII